MPHLHGPRTSLGTAADRLRIENVARLTRYIGDEASYYTRGISGQCCLVADALLPHPPSGRPGPFAPPVMASTTTDSQQQRTILGALRAGQKLFQFMSKPDMPTKAQLQQWLDSDPDFKARYDEAAAKGKQKRDQQQGSLDDEDDSPRRPAVLRGSSAKAGRTASGAEVAIITPARPLPEPQMGFTQTEPLTDAQTAQAIRRVHHLDEPSQPPQPMTPDPNEQELQAIVLRKTSAGQRPADILRDTPGFSTALLNSWRKDPDFKRRHDSAQSAGVLARLSQSDEEPGAPTPPDATPELAPEPAPVAAFATPQTEERTVFVPLTLDEAEQQWLVLETIRAGAAPSMLDNADQVTEWQQQPLFAVCFRQAVLAGQRLHNERQQERQQERYLAVSAPADKLLTYERALADAEYRALTNNRPAVVARVLTETVPAVTVREL